MQLLALVRDTFRESRNTRMFWVLIGISTVFAAALACLGFDKEGFSFFFGALRVPNPQLHIGSPEVSRFYGAIISYVLVDLYLGWVGVGLALIATCGIFPSVMSSGSVELLLSKPISRWKVFLGKYLGALTFVGVQVTYFVALIILIIGVKAGTWIWTCLWSIPLLVALFSYLYCVAVLTSVRNPSALTSLLVAFAFWFVCFLVQAVHGVIQLQPTPLGLSNTPASSTVPGSTAHPPSKLWGKVIDMMEVAYQVLPKTGEISAILGKQVDAAMPAELAAHFESESEGRHMSPQDREQLRAAGEVDSSIDPRFSLLSSLGFEAVVLLVAGWIFCRKDF